MEKKKKVGSSKAGSFTFIKWTLIKIWSHHEKRFFVQFIVFKRSALISFFLNESFKQGCVTRFKFSFYNLFEKFTMIKMFYRWSWIKFYNQSDQKLHSLLFDEMTWSLQGVPTKSLEWTFMSLFKIFDPFSIFSSLLNFFVKIFEASS